MKIELEIDNVAQELSACATLRCVPPSDLHHARIPCRHPFGVYNVSLERLFTRLGRLSEITKRYMLETKPINVRGQNNPTETFDAIVDMVELVVHSIGEHVDDIETICRTFFKSDYQASKSPLVRKLKSGLKPLRDPFTSISNHIKHSHNRIRIFETELITPTGILMFPGFFVESSDGEKIGPNPNFHSKGNPIVSVSTLLWNSLMFIYSASRILGEFVEEFSDETDRYAHNEAGLIATLEKIIELPLYDFGEGHPLNGKSVNLKISPDVEAKLNRMRGAIGIPWNILERDKYEIGSCASAYRGDGVTRTFDVGYPSKLNLVQILI